MDFGQEEEEESTEWGRVYLWRDFRDGAASSSFFILIHVWNKKQFSYGF